MIELAKLDDANGDTYVIEQYNDGSTWIGLYINEWERPIRVTDALKLIDESGLNTTANDLRAQLAETTGKLERMQKLWDLKCAELSIAQKSLNELRKADTVRPAVDLAAVWDEGYDAFDSNEAEGTAVGNPYRSDHGAEPILCSKGQLALALIEEFGGIDGYHHSAWVIDQVVRRLTGSGYEHWVSAMNDGEDGPNTYAWEVGIAP
jgi:hypothetical protein